MNRRVKKVVLAMAAAGLMASGYAFGMPHNVTTSLDCDGAYSGLIEQNVDVFPGSQCTLTNATITGNVQVWGAGFLKFCGTNTVSGNVSVTSYIDGVEYFPGALAVGCEGGGNATLNINPSEGNRGSGNLSCFESFLGSQRSNPASGTDTVNAHGNVSVIECADPGSLIDVLNVFEVTGPPPKFKQQKGNLTCFDNFNASFATANVQGSTSGDGSCID